MSYTALYRKFRPASFDDVKGQDHIVTTLRNQIQAGRIGHAYLFSGTRGTGKTTVAKIFARAVNCENPRNGSACGECETCKAIANGSSLNILEIDAASNNGVENIRNIIDEVAYSPTMGRYKVYIIDEAHMITPQAFNALLKTLEEPPEYVIFVLATTDPQKILTTILSRCQRYDFHRITIETIQDRLDYICKQESLDVEDKALRYIARMGDGSMRDSLSLLDQCVAFHLGEKLTYDDTLDILGAVDARVFDDMLRALTNQDIIGAMKLLEEIIAQGREIIRFTTDLVWYMRCVMLMQTDDRLEDVIDLNSEDMARLKETASLTDKESVVRYIQVLSELTAQIRYSPQKRILLEVTLIRLCRPGQAGEYAMPAKEIPAPAPIVQGAPFPADDVIPGAAAASAPGISVGEFSLFRDDIRGRLDAIENKLKNYTVPAPETEEEAKPKPLPAALKEDVEEILKNWSRILSSDPPSLREYLSDAKKSVTDDGTLLLVWSADEQDGMVHYGMMKKSAIESLYSAVEGLIGKKVKIELALAENKKAYDTDYVDLDSFFGDMPVAEEDKPQDGYGIYSQDTEGE